MQYSLGVEEFEPDHWVAWVFEHMGCYSTGQTRAEAISHAGAGIAAYHRWVGNHNPESVMEDLYIDAHVAEAFDPVVTSNGARPNAFFEHDRLLLKADDVEHALKLLTWTRRDLLNILNEIPVERWKFSPTGNSKETVYNIVKHIGTAEWWLMDRIGLSFPKDAIPGDSMERLEKARENLVRRAAELTDNEKVVLVEGETWSARKVLRRIVWHERDHTHQIEKLLPLIKN